MRWKHVRVYVDVLRLERTKIPRFLVFLVSTAQPRRRRRRGSCSLLAVSPDRVSYILGKAAPSKCMAWKSGVAPSPASPHCKPPFLPRTQDKSSKIWFLVYHSKSWLLNVYSPSCIFPSPRASSLFSRAKLPRAKAFGLPLGHFSFVRANKRAKYTTGTRAHGKSYGLCLYPTKVLRNGLRGFVCGSIRRRDSRGDF